MRNMGQLNRLLGPVRLFAILLIVGCSDQQSAKDVSATSGAPENAKQKIEIAVPHTVFPEQVFWGDLHVHSSRSFDSYSFGNTGVSGADAFRFARGEPVVSSTGRVAQLARPLDFLMVADHAEYLGFFPAIGENDPVALSTPLGKRWQAYFEAGDLGSIIGEYIAYIGGTQEKELPSEAFQKSAWMDVVADADAFNEPGRFTAFTGYEWTSMISGDNLHRVVVFKDDAGKTSRTLPFSAVDSNDPEDLWAVLSDYEQTTGGSVIAIPHNGNLSDGAMFSEVTVAGEAIDADYATRRARWEPLYEATQVKGDSESHPLLSPTDEFADFETWDQFDISYSPRPSNPDDLIPMLKGEYARAGLKRGLAIEADTGINPYKYGLIGSTDSHTGLSTSDDDNFFGKFPDSEPGADRVNNLMGHAFWENWRLSSSGYTGVWARANTREEIFNALKRKEVYATTGPRISLRFFGGWDFRERDVKSARMVETGYRRGVPMGGDLAAAPNGKSPKFLIAAAKDPDGANLDRIQVIKGWRNAEGELHEHVYDVALSDNREVDPATGKAPRVGSTVDGPASTYTNDIGAAALEVVWEDPDFDPAQRAFYYVRAIEIPTPRWSAYDAARFEASLPQGTKLVTQERAYSSPIWYTPKAPG